MKTRTTWLALALLLVITTACSSPGETIFIVQVTVTPVYTPFQFPATFTPTMPGPPTETNTPGPTRTPFSTLTPAPTLGASATPLVDIIIASSGQQPAISQDLAYFNMDRPATWEKETGEVLQPDLETLPDGLRNATASQNRNWMAFSRRLAEGDTEILIYSTSQGAVVQTVYYTGTAVLDLEISPDGQWLGIVAPVISILPEPTPTITPGLELTPTPLPSPTPTVAPPTATLPPEVTVTPAPSATPGEMTTPTVTPTPTSIPEPTTFEGEVYLFRLGSGAAPQKIGLCGTGCTGLGWSTTSSDLVWGDTEGLWRFEVGQSGEDAGLLLEPFISGVGALGQATDSYFPISWSFGGRYVLLRKGLQQGLVYVVLDTNSGRVENVPGTGEYSGPFAGFAWLPEDGFLVARPGYPANELLPALDFWALSPGQAESMFIRIGEIGLPGNLDTVPAGLSLLAEGQIGFALMDYRNSNNIAVNGVYILDPASGQVYKYGDLPFARVEALYWLDDLSGVLVKTASRLLFLDGAGGSIYSMARFLGDASCCFDWVIE